MIFVKEKRSPGRAQGQWGNRTKGGSGGWGGFTTLKKGGGGPRD